MFQFSGLTSSYRRYPCGWVAPFGYHGITGYLHLLHAFRSLSRPSSSPRAKASSMRPFLLLFFFEKNLFPFSRSTEITSYLCSRLIERFSSFSRLTYLSRLFDSCSIRQCSFWTFCPSFVENNGFEPLTPCVQGRCSSQLS